ncbi:MAG TPA: ATP-binding cassette domain-containing protein, partial [Phenylobacterium sp.]|nr:ATP-binding cassette domain-containing protein [Phenylobacterium sp.]
MVADLLGLSAELSVLRRIAQGEASDEDLETADWALEPRLTAALDGLGLGGLDVWRPAASLSGGEATRAALAGLIATAPDLLILDEPTNDMDAAGRALVAEAVASHRGGVLAASHDRALLRGMDRIVELSPQGVGFYGGGYDLFAQQKADRAEAAARQLDAARQEAARAVRQIRLDRERQALRNRWGRR